MHYQLSIAIKQRKCSVCQEALPKGTKHFIMSDWPEDSYPVKKNICLNCAHTLRDTVFLGFLKLLIKELENLFAMQDTLKDPTKQKIYKCYFCNQNTVIEKPEGFFCTTCTQPRGKEDIEEVENARGEDN